MPRVKKLVRRYAVGLDEPAGLQIEAIREREGISINAQIRKGVTLWLERKNHERAILDAAHRRKEKKPHE